MDTVAPLVGAWIEIIIIGCQLKNFTVAPLVGAWIEIKMKGIGIDECESLLL